MNTKLRFALYLILIAALTWAVFKLLDLLLDNTVSSIIGLTIIIIISLALLIFLGFNPRKLLKTWFGI